MYIRNLLLFICIFCLNTTYAQTTQVQFINNCADQSFAALDIYVDAQAGLPPEADDLFFRESTPFLNILSGSAIKIAIADLNSFDVNDTFYSITITLNQNNNYIIVAEGIESTSGYTPATPFALRVYSSAKNAASVGKTDILFLNDATDAPVMDVRTGVSVLANNLSYGGFSQYNELSSSNDFKFRLTNPIGSKLINTFDADLSSLNVDGKAVTILTSGFVNPSMNSSGPAMGLWMSTPDGGALTELTASTELEDLARVQLIHNSADTAVGRLDIYVNDEKIIDTLDYRHASIYMDAFAKTPLKVGIAKSGTGVQFFDTSITLDSGKVYAAALNGIKSDTNYKPLPDLKFDLFSGAREEAAIATNTDVLMMHGSTDLPTSRVKDLLAVINPFANLGYGDYGTGYYSFSTMGAFIIDTSTNNAFFKQYELNPTTLNTIGASVTVIYSGFLVTDSNSKGPDFGLWMAKAEGGPLVQLPPLFISVNDIETTAKQIKLWPNPATNTVSFNSTWNKVNIIVTDITGKVVLQKKDYVSNQVEISNLNTGNYILLLQAEGNTYYSKFTKQ